MMKIMEKINLREKTCLVVDNGQFHHVAATLSKEFGKVYYYTRFDNKGFASPNEYFPGYGFKEFEHIDDIFIYSDDKNKYSFDRVDLFVFTDLYYGWMQEHLKKLGKLVFGAAKGERLELDRWGFKSKLKELGLPVTGTKKILGLDKLISHLKMVKNKYVKISMFRGIIETFHHIDYNLSEPVLTKLDHDLGAIKNEISFIVEDEIQAESEMGFDGFCISGKFAKNSMFGIEIKDKAFFMKSMDYEELPKQIRLINSKFEETFKELNYNGPYSNEIRVTKSGIPYFSDFTARFPEPPSSVYCSMIDNLGEICFLGAQGIVVEPIFNSKYGAEIIITSDWLGEGNWQSIEFPKELIEWVKLRYACIIYGKYYCIPQGMTEVGQLVATGETIEEVVGKITKYAEKVKGYGINIKTDYLQDAINECEKTKQFGVNL